MFGAVRAVCLQTECGLLHVAGNVECLSWGLELVALPEQGPGFPALPGVPGSRTVCGLVPEGPVGRWPLKASVSVLLSESHHGGRRSLCGRGVCPVDCHGLATWVVCPQFAPSILDPLLKNTCSRLRLLYGPRRKPSHVLSGHLACVASGWPALAGLGVGACEQASCLGSNMAWGQSWPLPARAGLAAGSQGGQSRRQHGARWKGHLHPSPGPAAFGLMRHIQAHACRRSWQTSSLLPPRSQSGMWSRCHEGNPPTVLCGETAGRCHSPVIFTLSHSKANSGRANGVQRCPCVREHACRGVEGACAEGKEGKDTVAMKLRVRGAWNCHPRPSASLAVVPGGSWKSMEIGNPVSVG